MKIKKLFIYSLSFLVSSCVSSQPKNAQVTVLPLKDSTPYLQNYPPYFSGRSVASSGKLCDLKADRCSDKPLDQAEVTKVIALSDEVAAKLVEIEANEKKMGRDFKIAIIARQGSDLKKFKVLQDNAGSGPGNPFENMIKDMMIKTRKGDDDESGRRGFPIVTAGIRDDVLKANFDPVRSLKYSHIGIAVRNLPLVDANGKQMKDPSKGRWAVMQLLYSCDEGRRSYIYSGTIQNFFYDHLAEYGAQILVPSPDVQANLETILVDKYLKNSWLEKHYNALALPYDLEQQNSNQWVLEVLAAAQQAPGKILTREQAHEVLRETGYATTKVTPTGLYSAIRIRPIQKIVSHFMPVACMSGQPNIAKYGVGELISALSVEEYLERNRQILSKYEVKVPDDLMKSIDEIQKRDKKVTNTHEDEKETK